MGNAIKGGLVALALMSMPGCQGCMNDISARGGLVGTYKGDYIVISQSGGEIMDVYKLDDVYVESETGSDGWRFKDQNGNITFLGGDVKIIRMNKKNADLWDSYHEYPMEEEGQTYGKKFNSEN